jgi:hypothetical protein
MLDMQWLLQAFPTYQKALEIYRRQLKSLCLVLQCIEKRAAAAAMTEIELLWEMGYCLQQLDMQETKNILYLDGRHTNIQVRIRSNMNEAPLPMWTDRARSACLPNIPMSFPATRLILNLTEIYKMKRS